MAKRDRRFCKWFANNFHRMHLYSTSGESAFKGLGMFLTWGGSIFIYLLNDSTITQDALLFFAMGIILEYMGQFVSETNKGKPEQLLPGILTVANIFVYFFAFIQVGTKVSNQEIAKYIYYFQIFATCITVFIIFIDMIAKICLKEPADPQTNTYPERKLKDL